MIEFYQISSPDDYEYARFSRRGTWVPKPSVGVCEECGMTRQKRVPPLVIEWEPDSDVVGDFVWGGLGFEIVARSYIAEELRKQLSGFDICDVEMIEEPDHAGTTRTSTQGQAKRIRLPYAGPELCEMWVDTWASLDDGKSGLELEKVCGRCGFQFYRPKRVGLRLASDSGEGNDFFRVRQFPSWVFCSERARELIEEKGYSNVAFRDVC
jgi:hypothetical protein